MKRVITATLIISLTLITACGYTKDIDSNVESFKQSSSTITTSKVEIENSVCNDDDPQDQVFCLLKKKKYDEAEKMLATGDVEKKVTSLLSTYISCMKESAFTDECSETLSSLSELKSSEKVGSTKVGSLIILLSDKISIDAKRTAAQAVEEYNSKNFPPEIGMTEEKVLNSTWGKPQKVNRTKSKYGVREQWVYGFGRYVYLDDGIVTSIQD